ncbi:MAG: universal stress protein [Candidatus Methylomirabilales bacterium]
MYRRILVPLDGSQLAERILPHVETIAKSTGAEVVLLRTTDPRHGEIAAEAATEGRKWLESDQAQAAKYLEGVAKRLKDAGVTTRVEVLVGEPAVEILTAAEHENVDLIAMMSHGATGFNHFDRGSVAEKVLQCTTRPVLMVRAFRTLLKHLDEQEVWAIKG